MANLGTFQLSDWHILSILVVGYPQFFLDFLEKYFLIQKSGYKDNLKILFL